MAEFFRVALLEAKFRDVSFPVTDFRIQISHDIAQHKRPDQDGARVESTGRNPMTFSASIPFYRGIATNVTENWPELYPAHHRAFLSSMADRTAGVLSCPSFGDIIVKPVSCTSNLRADARSGEDVSAEWIEAPQDDIAARAAFAMPSPLNAALEAASTLNDPAITPALKKVDPDDRISIFEAMTKIAAVMDQSRLFIQQNVAMIDRLTYRLNVIHESTSSLMDPQLWTVKEPVNRLRDALYRLKLLGAGVTKDVSIYIVPAQTTVANLASDLKTEVRWLLELNPRITSVFFVEKGTFIRYYKRDVNPVAVAINTGGMSPIVGDL